MNEPDPITADEVRRIARLARLAITDDQVEEHLRGLTAVLGYVARLRTLDMSGVEPLAHVGEEPHRLRPDEPGPTLDTDALMRMAPRTMPPFVALPKVLGDGGGA